jgi:hypothetical protein
MPDRFTEPDIDPSWGRDDDDALPFAAPARPAPQGAPEVVPDDAWMPELLDDIREGLTAYLGEEAMSATPPMFYPEAIRSALHKAAFGKLPEEMYPEGSLLHRLRDAEAELATLRAQAVAGAEDGARLREIADFLHAHARDEGGYSEALRADIESDAAFLRSLTTPERAP